MTEYKKIDGANPNTLPMRSAAIGHHPVAMRTWPAGRTGRAARFLARREISVLFSTYILVITML
jgi:hypothetical protein